MRNWKRALTASALIAVVWTGQAVAKDKASPAKPKGFAVGFSSYVALPPATPSTIAESRTLREKDVVLSMPVAWEDRAIVPAGFRVRVAGADWDIKSDAKLTRAITASGGDLASLPEGAITYCGESFRKDGALTATLLTLGLSSLTSQLSSWLQVCAVDSDADGRFDKGFLVGTKRAEDRRLVDVEPVAYTVTRNEPIPNSRLDIVYYDGGGLNSENFEFHLFLEGEKQKLGGLTFRDNLPPVEIKEDRKAAKAREAVTPSSLQWYFPVKKKKLPQRFTVGNAAFTVTAVDSVAKTAAITVDKDPTAFPFALWHQGTTIYIYYYYPG